MRLGLGYLGVGIGLGFLGLGWVNFRVRFV